MPFPTPCEVRDCASTDRASEMWVSLALGDWPHVPTGSQDNLKGSQHI